MKFFRLLCLFLILALTACNIPQPVKSTSTTVVQASSTATALTVEGAATYGLQPSTLSVAPGETFDLQVVVEAGEQKIDVAQASLNFDPLVLEVVSISPGIGLPTELINSYDNSQGIIDYAHGALPPAEPISGTFTLTTITFKANAEATGTEISFVTDLPRQSGIFYLGNSVASGDPDSAVITVQETIGQVQPEQKAIESSVTPVISESTATSEASSTPETEDTSTPAPEPSSTATIMVVPTEVPTLEQTTSTPETAPATSTPELGLPTVVVTPPSAIAAPATASGLAVQTGGWKVFTVPVQAGEKVLTRQSLALDANGNPHIVFGAGGLQYASLSAAGEWTIQTLDASEAAGNYPSITLSPAGFPQVAYFDQKNEDLRFAVLENEIWTTEIVDSKGAVGLFTSIASDKNNQPAIAYFDDNNDNLKIAQKIDNAWGSRLVDSKGVVGFYASLQIDNEGLPRIAYYDYTQKDLKYAAGKSDSKWKIYTPDREGDVGQYVSLVIDRDGMPAFAYFDATNENLKFVRFDGKSWYIYVVDSAGAVGWYPSLAIDSQNRPHILYLDQASGVLRYAVLSEGKWIIRVLDNLGLTSSPPSIAIDAQGRPHIVFFDGNAGMLKYAMLEN